MTLATAIEKFGAVPVPVSGQSSVSGFAAMAGKKNRKSAAGLAARSSQRVYNSVRELAQDPPANLMIYHSDGKPAYANEFVGLKPGIYRHPFTWGFDNHASATKYHMSGSWSKVAAILPMGGNFLFICEGATPPNKDTADPRKWSSSGMGICCHKSLLTPEYSGCCSSAWTGLAAHMTLEIPSDSPYAIGIGLSESAAFVGDPAPKLSGPARFKTDRGTFTIAGKDSL
jgi:hypothetical protein